MWCAALLVASACAPDFPTAYEWEGEHVRFLSDQAEPPCAGTLAYLDEYTGLLKSELGSDAFVTYHWVRDYERLVEICDGDGGGCARGDDVYAFSPVFAHEIVHGVEPTYPAGNHFFSEGNAMLYGNAIHGMEIRRLAGLAEIDTAVVGEFDYGRAAHFAAFLAERYGSAAARRFGLDISITMTGAAAALAGHFSEAAEVIDAAYAAYPMCSLDSLHAPLYECSRPTVAPDDAGQLTIKGAAACDDNATVGPRDGWVYQYFAVEVLEGRSRTIEFGHEDPASESRAALVRCGGTCTDAFSLVIEAPPLGLEAAYTHVPAGAYYVEVRQRVEAPSPFVVRIRE